MKHRQPPEASTFEGHNNYGEIGHKVHSQGLLDNGASMDYACENRLSLGDMENGVLPIIAIYLSISTQHCVNNAHYVG